MKHLTHQQALLAAAASLPPEFSGPDLIVAAWKLRPTFFGLRGYEHLHPCANRVYARLDGLKGLARAGGELQRLGHRGYRLTALGRERARMAKVFVATLAEVTP